MKANDPYYVLAKYILPKEFDDSFEVTQIGEECLNGEMLLHIYLDERNIIILPKNQTTLQKQKKVVLLQAKSLRLWEDTVNLMPHLRQKWQSPHFKKKSH